MKIEYEDNEIEEELKDYLNAVGQLRRASRLFCKDKEKIAFDYMVNNLSQGENGKWFIGERPLDDYVFRVEKEKFCNGPFSLSDTGYLIAFSRVARYSSDKYFRRSGESTSLIPILGGHKPNLDYYDEK